MDKKFNLKNACFNMNNEEFLALAKNAIKTHGLLDSIDLSKLTVNHEYVISEIASIRFHSTDIDNVLRAINTIKKWMCVKDAGFNFNIYTHTGKMYNGTHYTVRLENKVRYEKAFKY